MESRLLSYKVHFKVTYWQKFYAVKHSFWCVQRFGGNSAWGELFDQMVDLTERGICLLFYFYFLVSENPPTVELSKCSLCFCPPLAVSESPAAVRTVPAEEGESSNDRGSFSGV